MLTPQLARNPRPEGKRAAIALAGGGPLGAFFELGTLQALTESIDGLPGAAESEIESYLGPASTEGD